MKRVAAGVELLLLRTCLDAFLTNSTLILRGIDFDYGFG